MGSYLEYKYWSYVNISKIEGQEGSSYKNYYSTLLGEHLRYKCPTTKTILTSMQAFDTYLDYSGRSVNGWEAIQGKDIRNMLPQDKNQSEKDLAGRIITILYQANICPTRV